MTLADLQIAMPLLALAIGALLTLLTGAFKQSGTKGNSIAVIAAAGAGLLAVQPLSVTLSPALGLSAGGLARLFTAFFSFLSAAVLLLPSGGFPYRRFKGEEYPATILFVTFGMVALASATNLLIAFLGLETMTFGFYFLTAIDRKHQVSGEAGLKFLLMGILSAGFLAFGIALLFCVSGSLDISAIVQLTVGGETMGPTVLAGWACLLIGLFFKLSLVPAHLWTPDVFDAAPGPVVAFLSGGSKGATILLLVLLWSKAGNLSMLRLPLFWIALLSMVVGNLAALRQVRVRRMLAYSSIAQMGYVMMALISYRGEGVQAAAFYAIAYAIMSLAAFSAVSILEADGCGSNIEEYHGRGYTHPLCGIVLALAMFGMAGIPPTVGFTGKFLLFTSAIRAGEVTLAVIGILTAAISIYYYLRIVSALYLQPGKSTGGETTGVFEALVLVLSAVLILGLGVFPSALLEFLTLQL